MNHVELFAGVGGFRRAMDLITRDLDFPIQTVAYSEIEHGTACLAESAVILKECHSESIDDRPNRKDQKQNDCGRQVNPGFPLLFAFYHITSPQSGDVLRCPC